MKFVHYFKEEEMSQEDFDALHVLIDECDFVRKKFVSELVDEGSFKSVICAYDDNGAMCGFAGVVLEYGYLQLNSLFVDYDARGKGYGKGLLQEVKAFAGHLNLDTVELIALEYSKPALRLYEKTGFIYVTKHSYFTSEMKAYVKGLPYVVGGMLNAISKRYGREGLVKGIEEVRKSEDLHIFDEAFGKPVKETSVKQVLGGEYLVVCAKCLERLGSGKKAQENVKKLMFCTLPANYKKSFVDKVLPGMSRESAHEFSLCLDAFYAFEGQERLALADKMKDDRIMRV